MSDELKTKAKIPLALKPGILVGLKTEVRGGVTYETKALSVTEAEKAARASSDATEVVKKEMIKTTVDAEEHDRACKVRNKARAMIESVCSHTPFGPMCPVDKEPDLDKAIDEAEEMVAAFHVGAKFSRVDVYAIKGYIAENDEKAAKGIAREIADLIGKMNAGVVARDPAAIKEAVRKAKLIEGMIDQESKERVTKALVAARASAKDIAKTIAAVGNANMILLTDSNKAILEEMARSFTVLDLDEPVPVEGEAIAPVGVTAVDVDPVDDPMPDLDLAAADLDEAEKAAGSPDPGKYDL